MALLVVKSLGGRCAGSARPGQPVQGRDLRAEATDLSSWREEGADHVTKCHRSGDDLAGEIEIGEPWREARNHRNALITKRFRSRRAVIRKCQSGREDLNLRPHGPEPLKRKHANMQEGPDTQTSYGRMGSFARPRTPSHLHSQNRGTTPSRRYRRYVNSGGSSRSLDYWGTSRRPDPRNGRRKLKRYAIAFDIHLRHFAWISDYLHE